jgi:hypothetical protein
VYLFAAGEHFEQALTANSANKLLGAEALPTPAQPSNSDISGLDQQAGAPRRTL